jgi:hypothetical protein
MADGRVAVRWGVRVEGSFVVPCRDGLSAFREESLRRAYGDDTAQAVVMDRDGWRVVSWGSAVRPDPLPPPQATGWLEALRRWGRNRLAFRRRGTRGG